MATLPLTKGYMATVDDADFAWLNEWKWTALVTRRLAYAYRRISKTQTLLMHRAILRAASTQIVDHVDFDGLNNRRDNLRLCTKTQNQAHSRHPIGTTGFRGVTLNKSAKTIRYVAQSAATGYIGSFDSAEDAAIAYDNIARELYGPFAQLNFP